MRTLRILCLLCGLAGLTAPALGDQADPRLDALFAKLKQVSGPAGAAPTEAKIWEIWIESSDPAAAALMGEGIGAMNRGDLAAALKTFDQLVAAAPKFAEAWNKRATVHFLLGHFRQSLDDIDRTLALEPRHFGALSGRGLVYIHLDDPARALAAFEAAQAVNPHMAGVRDNIELLRRVLKQREI